MLKDGRINVHSEERNDRPSVVSDDLVQSVEKICEKQSCRISVLSCEFPQISRTLLYEIITVRLGYHKFCARWVPKTLTGAHKTQRMASAFVAFLEQYHIDGDECLSHIIQVTGDKTWVSFLNVETKEQSKQWTHTHSPKEPKKFKVVCLSERGWQLFSGTGKEC
jgi:hypothetical protein